VVEALVASGITTVEVTLSTPETTEVLAHLASNLPDGVLIGAGTVLTPRQAETCAEAGATFLVSPVTAPEVIAAGHEAGIPVYPGALTPNELLRAQRLTGDLVKLFPASAVGPAYLRDLSGPFPDLELMPTGGILLDDVPAWLDAGARAVGLGGPLIGDALEGGSIEALRLRTAHVVGLVRAHRGVG
jgi:2-dehydro-3-deoxyphosphogluconate aldolase/(4S)-4-hydroxy-2-oxoglutarate aldolase